MDRKHGRRPRLEAMQRRLERWRQEFGGPGRPIPEGFWREAAALARVEGVAVTARALRLDSGRLARRLEAEGGDGDGAASSEAFVEVDAGRLLSSAGTVLRFESNDGERLEIELRDGQQTDIVAVAAAFWARRG